MGRYVLTPRRRDAEKPTRTCSALAFLGASASRRFKKSCQTNSILRSRRAPGGGAEKQEQAGNGEYRAQQEEIEPAHAFHEPARGRIDEGARYGGETGKQGEL